MGKGLSWESDYNPCEWQSGKELVYIFVYSLMFVIGLVYRRCTISSGGGQFKAAQHSGYSMDMDDCS
jgi:hypothetical protein